jgi:hypothetical protein
MLPTTNMANQTTNVTKRQKSPKDLHARSESFCCEAMIRAEAIVPESAMQKLMKKYDMNISEPEITSDGRLEAKSHWKGTEDGYLMQQAGVP